MDNKFSTGNRSGRTTRFDSWQGRSLLFSVLSIHALGLTQLHIQWIPWIYMGMKWPDHEVDHTPPSTAKIQNVCVNLCLHNPYTSSTCGVQWQKRTSSLLRQPACLWLSQDKDNIMWQGRHYTKV